MISVRVHGRGGQGAVIASKLLATAFFSEGWQVQAFPSFGAERTGAPVMAFLRIDRSRIDTHYQVYEPDHVLVLDPVLLQTVDVASGLRPGGWVIVNTQSEPSALRLPEGVNVAICDATRIALAHGLGSRTTPIVNTAMAGAFARATALVKLASVVAAIPELVPANAEANQRAAAEAFDAVRTVPGANFVPANIKAPRLTFTVRTPDDVPDGTPMSVSTRSTAELSTGSWRTFRPEYVTRPSPCNLDCPAGTDVRKFLASAARGDFAGAWRTILEHNPLPGVCGRVCYHPCETSCNRGDLDGRIAVHAIERAIAAEAHRQGAVRELLAAERHNGGARIAVVGSGPAGLSCAYHVARRGHTPVVFESRPEPGGMLRYGIPEYRLPRTVLTEELDLLRGLGVEFHMHARLGTSLAWSDLHAFDAVFLAVGNQRSRGAAVPGEDLAGVSPAIDFLRQVNAGVAVRLADPVVIIGGGNTAIDAARVALRLGARPTIVYRRTREEMPAHPDEIAQAEVEGVQFVLQAAPIRFQGFQGALASLHCQRTRPGPPDASGRRSPEPVLGDTFTIPCKAALTAIGEELERETFDAVMEIARGRLKADGWGRTARAPMFAGGDAATGAGTVTDAIGSGRRAAEAIDAWLARRELPSPDERKGDRVGRADVNFFYFGRASRATLPMLHRSVATSGFQEVATGLSWEEAIAEADRCFTCGDCTECGNCVVFCPDMAVSPAAGGGYSIDYAHCKGCGICVAECPRGAMALVAEGGR